MAFGYSSNPAGGAHTSPSPGKRVDPAATLPSDGDAATSLSVQPGLETPLDWIAFLQRQGALGDALGGAATSFDGSSNPTTWNDLLSTNGAPISGLDVLPTFAAASAFGVAIGAGSGYLNTSVAITPGESTYRTIYWSAQGQVCATPDGTHDRIDAVTVTPSTFGNEATLSVVTGTPAAVPLAPAIPAGSGALFYVYVPTGAADSTSFRACRGMWRRVGYPWSGMSGIISGAELSWDYTADPASAGSQIYFGAPDLTSSYTIHRLLIDGEPIEWAGFNVGATVDSTANPFGTTASGSFDRPYYIYAVGGRNSPMPSVGFGGNFLNPVTIVESTVAPNVRTGKPTGNLTVNGVTVGPNAAVYIGLGFVVQGTTRRRGCLMDAEMTMAFNPLQILSHTFTTSAHEDLGTFTGGCAPIISTKMRLNVLVEAASAAAGFFIYPQNFPPAASTPALVAGLSAQAPASGLGNINGVTVPYTPRTGAEIWAVVSSSVPSGCGMIVGAMGFNHRVNRICVGY